MKTCILLASLLSVPMAPAAFADGGDFRNGPKDCAAAITVDESGAGVLERESCYALARDSASGVKERERAQELLRGQGWSSSESDR